MSYNWTCTICGRVEEIKHKNAKGKKCKGKVTGTSYWDYLLRSSYPKRKPYNTNNG